MHQVSRYDMTMAEVLSAHGYQDRQILGGDHSNFYDIRDWYGKPVSYWDGTHTGAYANDDKDVLKQLKELPDWNGTPEFIQLHTMSTHALGARENKFEKWNPTFNYYANTGLTKNKYLHQQAIINYYDNGLVQFDHYVKRIIDILEQRGYLQDALLVITSDHGEMLGEHNRYSHANGVYQPVLEVPLLMFRFGHTGPDYNTTELAAQIDIAPTIIAELGLPTPERWTGRAIDQLDDRRYLFFEHSEEFGLIDFSIKNEKWKFWTDRVSGQEYAFELKSDPGELENRIVSIPHALRSDWHSALAPSIASSPLR